MKKFSIFTSIISAKPLNNVHLGGFSIFIILLASTICSCTTSKNLSKSDKSKDSIVYVDKIRIDTIREKITINEGIDNEIAFKCDSTSLNQSYKSGGIQYKVIKEKAEVKFIIKKDSSVCTDKYQSMLKSKDSLQKVVNKSFQSKKITKQSFWQKLKANIFMVLFFIILILWFFGITPRFLIKTILKI